GVAPASAATTAALRKSRLVDSTLPFGTIDISSLPVEDFRRFHHRLGERWVRMNCHSHIGGESAHFNREHAFCNQFALSSADNAHSKYAFRFRIDQQLSKTFGAV